MVMDSIRKKFIESPLLKQRIGEYVDKFLSRVWVANVDIQHSPLATKIYLEVVNPRTLLGRRNRKIEELKRALRRDLGVENPQIIINEIKNPWLEPKIVAKKVALGIMRGRKVRALLFRLAKQVMAQEDAMGVEIIADGKLGAKGARSRKIKVYFGFVPKAGDPANKVRKAHLGTVTKYGVIGITVKIATKDLYAYIKGDKEEQREEEKAEEVSQPPQHSPTTQQEKESKEKGEKS